MEDTVPWPYWAYDGKRMIYITMYTHTYICCSYIYTYTYTHIDCYICVYVYIYISIHVQNDLEPLQTVSNIAGWYFFIGQSFISGSAIIYELGIHILLTFFFVGFSSLFLTLLISNIRSASCWKHLKASESIWKQKVWFFFARSAKQPQQLPTVLDAQPEF